MARICFDKNHSQFFNIGSENHGLFSQKKCITFVSWLFVEKTFFIFLELTAYTDRNFYGKQCGIWEFHRKTSSLRRPRWRIPEAADRWSSIELFAYADDIDIVDRNARADSRIWERLHHQLNCGSTTKYMVMSRQEPWDGANLLFGIYSLEEVQVHRLERQQQ